MRIRKRKTPLPLLSSLSDPNLNYGLTHFSSSSSSSPSLVQQLPKQQQTNTHVDPPTSQPSDHLDRRLLPPIGPSDSRGFSNTSSLLEALKGEFEDDDGPTDEGNNKGINDPRKGSMLGAESVSGFALESSCSSHRILGKLFEGERAFPVKKPRGSFRVQVTRVENEKRSTPTKMDKPSDGVQKSEDKKQEIDRIVTSEGMEQNVGRDTSSPNNSNRARGNAIMEGSRCSRVNGRGWRCCQQTLVGYSLCEHHLGKGRLRSLNSVRNRSIGSIESKSKKLSTQSHHADQMPNDIDDDWKHDTPLDVNHRSIVQRQQQNEHKEEKMSSLVAKKRMKLGTVKARSMSSLLGQTNSAIGSAVEDENIK